MLQVMKKRTSKRRRFRKSDTSPDSENLKVQNAHHVIWDSPGEIILHKSNLLEMNAPIPCICGKHCKRMKSLNNYQRKCKFISPPTPVKSMQIAKTPIPQIKILGTLTPLVAVNIVPFGNKISASTSISDTNSSGEEKQNNNIQKKKSIKEKIVPEGNIDIKEEKFSEQNIQIREEFQFMELSDVKNECQEEHEDPLSDKKYKNFKH